MRFAGTASWRFAEGIEQAPLVALFVRDRLGLEVLAEAVSPSRLDGELPDHSTLLDSEGRAAAGAAWTGLVAGRSGAGHPQASGRTRQRGPARLAATAGRRVPGSVFDPPEFASLADRPALADAVRVSFNGALRWADAQRRTLLRPPQGRPGQFDYDVVRTAAEQTAHRHQVSPDAVRACALVLPVEGIWWNRFGPGAVLCSVHAARDPGIAQSMLTDASSPASPTDPSAPIEDRTTAAVAGPVPSARILRAALAVQLALFAARLIIGIVVNLYVKVPDVHPGSASAAPTAGYFGDLGAVLAWALTAGPVPLTLHVVLAIVLIVIGLGLIPLARRGGAAQIVLTTLAALCTIGAAFNGGSFLIFGNADNLSSLIMESLSTAAATCYVAVLVRATTVTVPSPRLARGAPSSPRRAS